MTAFFDDTSIPDQPLDSIEATATANRRLNRRVTVRLPCHVVWPLGGRPNTMLTENISRDGLLVHWDPALPAPQIGDKCIIDIELPELAGFERRCLRCQAIVERTQPGPDEAFTWVGLSVHAMIFETL